MKRLSIRTYLLLLVMAVSVPLAAILGYDIVFGMHEAIAQTKSSLRILNGVLVNNAEHEITHARLTLEKLAERPLVKQVNPKNCDPELKDFLEINSNYSNILYSDLQGNLICSALSIPRAINNSDQAWFKEFIQRKNFTISKPYKGRVTGKMVAMLSTPIRNAQNEIVGGMHLPLDIKTFDPHIPPNTLPASSRFGFFAPDGTMIWRNLDPEKVIGVRPNAEAARQIVKVRDGEIESLAVDGVVRYFTVATMPKTGWIAFVGVPADMIYANAKRHALTQTLLAIGGFAVLWLTALLIAARISKPISALEQTALAVHQGNLTVKASLDGPIEVHLVALEFNSMIEAQRHSGAQLRAFLENSAVIAWLKDEAGHLVFASENFLRRFSPKQHDVIGKMQHEFWPRENVEAMRASDLQLLAQGGALEVTQELSNPDGSVSWWLINKFIFDGSDGKRLLGQLAVDITESKQAELRVRASEARYDRAVNGANDGIWEEDFIRQEYYLSPRWKQLLGYEEHELASKNASFRDPIHPEESARVLAQMQLHLQERQPFEVELRMLCKNGEYRWFSLRGQAMWGQQGQPLSMAGSMTDITARKLAENDLRIAATAFESQEGMTIAAADGTILRVNRAFSKITGYSPEEVLGKNPRFLQSGRHDAGFYRAMWDSITTRGNWEGEIWNRRKNGEIYPEYLIITAVKDQHGCITNYVATFNDITTNKAAADEIMNLAFYDPLTQLPNRRLLMDRIKQALGSSARNSQQGGLLFIDLDHFKVLNDTLGHSMGDALLQQVAQRLTASVRFSDTVARLGGDEFVVMLEDLSSNALDAAAECKAVGQKILLALNQPYLIDEHEHRYSASIGATLFDGPHICIDELLQQADIAMYQAKLAGRNGICFFDPKMQVALSDRAAMENELHKVLESQQFRLHYQVQVDGEMRPLGAEALLRWVHPEKGIIPPAHFIPVAEESGLIVPIGKWVIETACAQLKRWEQDSITCELVLAVNVSAKQFHQINFVEQVREVVQRHAIKPHLLKLELTESMLLEKIEETILTINNLKELGILFSLDDFGTGYSSLQYLKRLPLDQLKIDQSFVRDLADDSSDKAIVRTIIAMAHSLGLDVIAEGVETEQQKVFLTFNGCAHYQGYLFGKPVPIEEFERTLRQGARADFAMHSLTATN